MNEDHVFAGVMAGLLVIICLAIGAAIIIDSNRADTDDGRVCLAYDERQVTNVSPGMSVGGSTSGVGISYGTGGFGPAISTGGGNALVISSDTERYCIEWSTPAASPGS